MEELRHALHAAADEPPPTRIDLDELIDGTRRRSRRQYRLGALAGASVLTAGAVLVPTFLLPAGGLGTAGGGGGAPPGCPTAAPSGLPAIPVPSESMGVVAGPPYDPSVPEASRRAYSGPPESPPGSPLGSPPAQSPPPSGHTSPPPSVDASPPPPVASPPVVGHVAVPAVGAGACPPDGPIWQCEAASSPYGSSPDIRLGYVCVGLPPRLPAVVARDLPKGWSLRQSEIGDDTPSGYTVGLQLADGDRTMSIKIQVRKRAAGDVRRICGAVAAERGLTGAACAVGPGGDAVLVDANRHEVIDVRPSGSVVIVDGAAPVTVDQLTALARDKDVDVLN